MLYHFLFRMPTGVSYTKHQIFKSHDDYYIDELFLLYLKMSFIRERGDLEQTWTDFKTNFIQTLGLKKKTFDEKYSLEEKKKIKSQIGILRSDWKGNLLKNIARFYFWWFHFTTDGKFYSVNAYTTAETNILADNNHNTVRTLRDNLLGVLKRRDQIDHLRTIWNMVEDVYPREWWYDSDMKQYHDHLANAVGVFADVAVKALMRGETQEQLYQTLRSKYVSAANR